jgi:hypothetical protein
MTSSPDAYDLRAIAEIHRWKRRQRDWLERALLPLQWPTQRIAALASRVPGVDWAVERSVRGLTLRLNELALWTVRAEAIYAEHRRAGLLVARPEHLYRHPLEHLDRVVGRLSAKYIATAGGEGVAAGSVGILALPADVVAIVVLNLRAVGEYATYYGRDLADPHERLFALDVLQLALSPEGRVKKAALGQLMRLARDAATDRIASRLATGAMSEAVSRFAESLGAALTRLKASQFIPALGLVIGGYSNAILTRNVCAAAANLYRERFLAAQYGPEWIQLAAGPAGEDGADPASPWRG